MGTSRQGWAQIIDGKTVAVIQDGKEVQRITCEHLLIASGSSAVELPFMPFGSGDGKVISSTEALSPKQIPKNWWSSAAVIFGLELGITYRKLGSEVAVVEAMDRILPAYDEELTKVVRTSLKQLGIEVHLGLSVQGMNADNSAVRLKMPLAKSELACDQVLVAVGRRPRTQGFGLESLLLDMNGRAVKIDDQCRTSMRNVGHR